MNNKDRSIIRCFADLDKLKGRRVLITGGTGFVGTWMQYAPGVNVTALNQLQYLYGKWDYADWDYIVHLAPPPETAERVIACARRCNATILFSSSGAVYDKAPGDYARSKMDDEARLLDSGVDVRIARMFAFAGAHMPNRFALINYIWDAIGGGPIKIRGDNVERSYLYAAEMAVWMWRILTHGTKRSIYEVGSDQAVTMEELAAEVSKNFAPKPAVVYERMFGTDPRPRYVPYTTATMLSLGVKQYIGFEDTIRRTVKWYQGEVEL
jgi:nucleoside-diphosphate-sugar epimerase